MALCARVNSRAGLKHMLHPFVDTEDVSMLLFFYFQCGEKTEIDIILRERSLNTTTSGV